MRKTAVVALGGNAITRVAQAGSYIEQEANAAVMATMVCSLWDAGWRLVLVHGNGPQVGNLAIQHDEAAPKVPALPLFCLNAMTEGQIGSLLALALRRVGDERLPAVACLITHVVVSADDAAFDVLVTAVEKVMLDFGTPRQRTVSEMTDRDAQRYLEDGQFPDGSMGPKVRAAIQFIRGAGRLR